MLSVSGLTKSYGTSVALADVDLSVAGGEIVAVIGPNGAGKSTLFKILSGVEFRDGGTCLYDDRPLEGIAQSQLGYLAEFPYFYDNFTAIEMIRFEIAMRGIQIDEIGLLELAREFRVDRFSDTRMRDLSQGMAKRVSLVCAFLGNPSFLILDEPLNGIDIQTVLSLKTKLLELRSNGSCIVISSHVLSFLDGLSDRVLLLKDGRLAFEAVHDGEPVESTYRRLFDIEDGR